MTSFSLFFSGMRCIEIQNAAIDTPRLRMPVFGLPPTSRKTPSPDGRLEMLYRKAYVGFARAYRRRAPVFKKFTRGGNLLE
jgi:hypothetical protein